MAGKHQAKEKGMIQKAIDAVDHVIHPEHQDQGHDVQVGDESADEQNDSAPQQKVEAADLSDHPKFSKFKTGEKSK